MDKTVILAVAGSGKTSHIIDSLTLKERALLITYTDANAKTLRRRAVQKFGHFPDNIRLYTYFTFLYSFSYRPFLAMDVKARGINWEIPRQKRRGINQDHIRYYQDSSRRLYYNRIAKLLAQRGVIPDVILRIEKYFDRIYLDEVQDLAGHDFNFFASLCDANVAFTLVGDYFQHTFDTSRDGSVNRTLYDDVEKYIKRLEKAGLAVDRDTLKRSYRCSPSVCKFITDAIGIEIDSHRTDDTLVSLVEDDSEAEMHFNCDSTVKLFYSEHYKYPCYSQNWGASKGEDHYDDVCVVLSEKNYKLLEDGNLRSLKPQTRNKLYVACTRSKNNLFFISDKHLNRFKDAAVKSR